MKKLLNKYIPLAYGQYFNTLSYFSRKKATEKAFELFCTPRKGRVLPAQSDYLEQAKDTVLRANGIPVQTYRWRGQGPTLLLMHGWESNTFRWRNLIPQLVEAGFDIVSMDAPGHGYSGSPIFNAPLYADCAQKVIERYRPEYLIGHSLGGMTMIYNQYKFKNDGIKKLVALGAPSELSDFLRQYRKTLGLSNRLMMGLENCFVEKFNFRPTDFSTSKFAATLKVPGLLVHDEQDRVAPIWCSEEVHANWKDSVFIKTKGLGHSLHQEQVHRQVVDFLKS